MKLSSSIKFINLQKVYSYLDVNASKLENNYEIYKCFAALDDKILTDKELLFVTIEKDVWKLSFYCSNNRILPGNISDLIKANTDYLEKRYIESQSLLLKAVYAEVLFNCNIYKYINDIVKNNLLLFQELIKTSEEDLAKRAWIKISHIAKILIEYTVISKNKLKNEVKKAILNSICNYKILEDDENTLVRVLIELVLEYPKFFKNEDLKNFSQILWDISIITMKQQNYILAEHELKLGLRIEQKLKNKPYDWNLKIGECYERQINNCDTIGAVYWCVHAIEHYKSIDKIGHKIAGLEKKYIELKNKQKFGNFEGTVDLTLFINMANEILKEHPSKILKYLATSNNLLPPKDGLIKKYSIIQDIMPVSYLDSNMHVSKTLDLKSDLEVCLSNYRNFWDLYQVTIQKVIYDGIIQDKINTQNLINYLFNNSWFFDIQTKKVTKNKKIKYNWSISIISIFKKYFEEIKRYNTNPKIFYPDIIAITDSLVLKFEALLRLYFEHWKQSTFKTIAKEKGIIREKDIMDLLCNDFLIEKFDFCDLLYFKYLFIAKEGLNLRNTIAHSLLLPEQYTYELFNLVFFAFLRLSKYKLPQ